MANKFDCDKTKARSNFRKHRIPFTEGCRVFSGHVLTAPSKQNTTANEARYATIGALENNQAAVVIWTKRKHLVRVISVRMASRKEREQYYAHIEKTIN